MTDKLSHDWNQSSASLLKKSCAQVEPLVVPQKALPKAGGLKPGRKQNSPINIRLNAAEKEVVKQKAERAGLSVHAFLKCLALGADYDPKLRLALLQVNRELTAQGRNLNQIARWVNSGYIRTSESLLNAIEAINVPLTRALLAVKAMLAGNAPQP
jgi:hypothetical protein